MSGDESRSGFTSWFVRRAGLARCATIATVVGFCLAALFPGWYFIAVAGLSVALTGILAGHAVSRLRPGSRTALGVILLSVVLVGLFAGLLLGTLRISSLLNGELSGRIGQSVRAEVVVTGPVRAGAGWQSATAVVKSLVTVGGARAAEGKGSGAGEKVLLEVAPPDRSRSGGTEADSDASAAAPEVLSQGALLSVTGTLCAPEGPAESGFDQSRQLLHQGIQVVLRVEAGAFSVRGHRAGVSGWFDRLRKAAKEHLSLGPDKRVNEVLQGVVMGDTAGIDQAWMEAFRRSGTAHMLSVSGLHVASLAAIMIALAGFAGLSRRAGYVLAAAAALLMVPFVGASPPIVRSAAMILVVLGGRLVGRRRDAWQGLAFAALVVLAPNPYALFDVGFQLSFCAFAGMIGLVRPMERLLTRFPGSIRANLAVSLAATLGTAPVSMAVFGRTSLISPIANLLVVPTLGSVTGLGMASVLLGFVWHGFSAALDTLASLPMTWTIVVSSLCAQAPVLDARAILPFLFALGGGILALPAALTVSGRVVKAPLRLRLPAFERALIFLRRHRPRSPRRGSALACALVIAGLVFGAAVYPAAAAGVHVGQLLAGGQGWPSQVEVRVLDVGQGNAILVRTPQHHAALFDGGPAGCDLGPQLRALGVKRLDLVVISHPHADHFAGLLEALDSLQVQTFIDRTEVIEPADGSAPGGGRTAVAAAEGNGSKPASRGGWVGGEDVAKGEAAQYLLLRKRLQDGGCRLVLAASGASLSMDGVRVVFFAPSRPLVLLDQAEPWGEGRDPPSGDELNGGSLVALLTAEDAEVLLPGDAEASALEGYHLPPADAIVVPHHGSRDGVSPPLLATVRPRLAVISVGRNNTFGHPDRSTVAALVTAGDTVIRTDECGWVSLRLHDHQMSISTERTPAK